MSDPTQQAEGTDASTSAINGHSNGNGHSNEPIFDLPVVARPINSGVLVSPQLGTVRLLENGNLSTELGEFAPENFTIEHARVYIDLHRVEERAMQPIHRRYDIPSVGVNRNSGYFVQTGFYREESQTTEDGETLGTIDYPEVLVNAVATNIAKFSNAFDSMVQSERRINNDPTAYAAGSHADGTFRNLGLQIDMAAIPKAFIDIVERIPQEVLEQIILERVFEFENSLAMYNFMRNVFTNEEGYSYFKEHFDGALERVREATGKRIVIATLTDIKYTAIRRTELGLMDDEDAVSAAIQDGLVQPGEKISEAEAMQRLSRHRIGFDGVLTAKEVEDHLANIVALEQKLIEANQTGDSDLITKAAQALREADNTIFYVRSSLPVVKLKRPDAYVDLPPIVQNEDYLRVLRQRSVTPNVDLPGTLRLPINDSKEYMEPMGMAVAVHGPEDLIKPESLAEAERDCKIGQIGKAQTLLDQLGNERYLINKKYSRDLTKLEGEELEKQSAIQAEVDAVLPYARENTKQLKAALKQLLGRINGGSGRAPQSFEEAISKMQIYDQEGVPHEQMQVLLDNLQKLLGAVGNVEGITLGTSIAKIMNSKGTFAGTRPESHLTDKFKSFLESRGVVLDEMDRVKVRAKPMVLSYGAYGHITKKTLFMTSFWNELLQNIDARGPQVLQTEVSNLNVIDIGPVLREEKIVDPFTGEETPVGPQEYACIDRLFFMYNFNTGRHEFIHGFRNHIPADDIEVKNGRIHGNEKAVYTEIRARRTVPKSA